MVALGKRWAERVAEKWVLSRRVMYLYPLLSVLPIHRNANRSLISASFKKALSFYIHHRSRLQRQLSTRIFPLLNCKLKGLRFEFLFVLNFSENSEGKMTIALKVIILHYDIFLNVYLLINKY